jgi:hypothetical protein
VKADFQLCERLDYRGEFGFVADVPRPVETYPNRENHDDGSLEMDWMRDQCQLHQRFFFGTVSTVRKT